MPATHSSNDTAVLLTSRTPSTEADDALLAWLSLQSRSAYSVAATPNHVREASPILHDAADDAVDAAWQQIDFAERPQFSDTL
jgi:hypothetical protein